MGIIWYFELLAFALDLDDKEQRSLYFFDFLNMMQVLDITPVVLPTVYLLQGVWVFLTFVCKRNVLQVVTMKSDRLYSALIDKSKSSKLCQPGRAE